MHHFLFLPALPFAVELVLGGIIGGLGGFVVSSLAILLINALMPKDAKSIAIFGSKGAGKTTLWEQLKGVFQDKEYSPTLGVNAVDEFTVEFNGKKKTIKKSADFGGDDNLVKRYGEIIEDKTFIYYLIDLTRLNDIKKETRARLQAITKVIKERKIESGLKLVGTHYAAFQKTTGLSKDQAKQRLFNSLDLKSIKDVKIDDVILVLELTDRRDIEQILEQIIA